MDIEEENERLAGRRGLNEPDWNISARLAAWRAQAEFARIHRQAYKPIYQIGKVTKEDRAWERQQRKEADAKAKEAAAAARSEAKEAARKRKLARDT